MTFFSRMNPTLRGFLVIAAIALAIWILNLEVALLTVTILLQVAFFLAIAFFLYLLWRERREEISMWPARAKTVFYGAALVAIADVGAWVVHGFAGAFDRLAFFLVLIGCGFALWRTWRDQHTWT